MEDEAPAEPHVPWLGGSLAVQIATPSSNPLSHSFLAAHRYAAYHDLTLTTPSQDRTMNPLRFLLFALALASVALPVSADVSGPGSRSSPTC